MNVKALVLNYGTVLCAPPFFSTAVDVGGSESIASHTAPVKFVKQVLHGRQRIYSMHGNDVMLTLARVQWCAFVLA